MAKGRHPNSLKNLIHRKKGDPALPGAGRPAGSLSLIERIDTFLDVKQKIKMPDGSIQDKIVLDGVIGSLISSAQKGNIRAIQLLLERRFGKEMEKLEIAGTDGKPIGIEYSARLSEARCRIRDALGSRSRNNDAGTTKNRSILSDDSGTKS